MVGKKRKRSEDASAPVTEAKGRRGRKKKDKDQLYVQNEQQSNLMPPMPNFLNCFNQLMNPMMGNSLANQMQQTSFQMPQKAFSGNLVSHLPDVFNYIGYQPAGN